MFRNLSTTEFFIIHSKGEMTNLSTNYLLCTKYQFSTNFEGGMFLSLPEII